MRHMAILHVVGKGNKLIRSWQCRCANTGRRVEKNTQGGALRYQSVQEHGERCCARARVVRTLHRLRHTYATELVPDGVSPGTIRRRLGHKTLQTTLREAEQNDASAGVEVRAWRRRRIG